jgi:hypothetical protein
MTKSLLPPRIEYDELGFVKGRFWGWLWHRKTLSKRKNTANNNRFKKSHSQHAPSANRQKFAKTECAT